MPQVRARLAWWTGDPRIDVHHVDTRSGEFAGVSSVLVITSGKRLASALAAALVGGALSLVSTTPAHAAPVPLTGLFQVQAGSWVGDASTGHVQGTYFRMAQPGGNTYLANSDSRAANKTYTILNPGTDGGLKTGVFQTAASPAFDASGNALSAKVTAPETFFGVKFSTATNATDPQTGLAVAAPTIAADGTTLTGDLRAFAASWNTQNFNQGSPKPDGTSPNGTTAVSGTYNPETKAFHITWRSLIVGGPFNSFIGEWHLVGTFVPNVSISATLPAALIGKYYSGKFTATGGTTSRTWTVVAGSVPAGLKLSTSGSLTGTPTAASESTFTVQVTDTAKPKNYATKTVTLVVPPVVVNAITVPGGVVGKAYTRTTFKATGGKGSLVWSVVSGSLPPGVKLSYGALSGTPTAAGTYPFTVQVADSAVPKNLATRAFSITIDPVTVNATVPPAGTVKKYYSTKFTANGGKSTLVWTVISGSLPPGVKLATSGTASGTPTTAGTYAFTVQVADGSTPKNLASRAFTITIN